MFAHILFPTDGSAGSTAALTTAALLAKLVGAKMTALCVVGPYVAPFGTDSVQMSAELKLLRERCESEEAAHARQILEAVKKTSADYGVNCECVIATADQPYRAIIAEAAKSGCDLIVMASHGRRGLEGMLLGSETQKVLTHSKTRVLVCR